MGDICVAGCAHRVAGTLLQQTEAMFHIPPPAMQSLFSFMFAGLGAGLGGIAGGMIMQSMGSQALFAVTALVVLGGSVAALLAQSAIGCCEHGDCRAEASG